MKNWIFGLALAGALPVVADTAPPNIVFIL